MLEPDVVAALKLTGRDLIDQLGARLNVVADNDALIGQFGVHIWQDLENERSNNRRSLIIAPVGPVGQYDLLCDHVLEGDQSLSDLSIIVMDEYLSAKGSWIDADHPLSFRGHMSRAFARLPEARRPNIIVPNPDNLGSIEEVIDDHGGISTCYAGVGITGHLAFNEPIDGMSAQDFAALKTRVVTLLGATRVINSVTAARGNIHAIPLEAVTVGMAEILSARKLRLYLNREWQTAVIRRLVAGPITATFPASLVQTHQNWSINAVEYVLKQPEATLQ